MSTSTNKPIVSKSTQSSSPRPIEVIGCPVDFGGNLRGVGMAPTAFRLAGLVESISEQGLAIRDGGDIEVAKEKFPRKKEPPMKDIRQIYENLADRVTRSLKGRRFPLILGGDHSIAIGTIAGAARHFKNKNQRMGVLWVDAHGDMNTPETSPSGNIHGMPLAASLGEGISALVKVGGFSPKIEPQRCALVGIRNLDDAEKENIARFGVKVFTMKDIDRRGLSAVLEEAIAVASKGLAGMHVSFDLDVVDPKIAPGVGTAVPGGMSYREAHLTMELISDSKAMTSLEVVEANPILDIKNSTAQLGVELILSALGKSIY